LNILAGWTALRSPEHLASAALLDDDGERFLGRLVRHHRVEVFLFWRNALLGRSRRRRRRDWRRNSRRGSSGFASSRLFFGDLLDSNIRGATLITRRR
jgi:hypothetical protein